MKVAGIKINLCCVVAVLIGLFIGGHLLCSCAKCDNIKVGIKKKEGFENMGAPVNPPQKMAMLMFIVSRDVTIQTL